jgi:hypothetical protein
MGRQRPTRPPYEYPVPQPGDFPRPKWWARARRMRNGGLSIPEIASTLGKGTTAVRNAVSIRYWQQTALAKMNYSRDEKHVITAYRKKWKSTRDHKREYIRACAREQWRTAGGKPEALESFYRKYECL